MTRDLVLHTRVVTGTGGGPDKTILHSPRYLADDYRMLCAFMRHPDDSPKESNGMAKLIAGNHPGHPLKLSSPGMLRAFPAGLYCTAGVQFLSRNGGVPWPAKLTSPKRNLN